MTPTSAPLGRRERNKMEKRDRIIAAAGSLFAERGVDEVTTQEIAERADIGTGTLFLYAKTKGELLLMVQNAHYAEALSVGLARAESTPDPLAAVLEIIRPVVECNRVQVDNGRTYLREMAFGDPAEPHHAEARAISAQTEEAIAAILARSGDDAADLRARVVSSVMFLAMAAADTSVESAEIVEDVRRQLTVILVG